MTQAILPHVRGQINPTTLNHFPDLAVIDGTPRVSSLSIAEHFQKRHEQVLRKVRQTALECPQEFNEHNFALVEYVDEKGESRPMYQLSRDGFTLLAMDFAGKKALAWKIRYIEAFNAMEKALLEKAKPAPEALLKPKQKALPAAYDPLREKVGQELARIDFYIKEIDAVEERVFQLLLEKWRNEHPDELAYEDKPHMAGSSATRYLWSAINSNLEALRESVKARLELCLEHYL